MLVFTQKDMLVRSLSFALFAVAATAANAAIIYDNQTGATQTFSSSVRPNYVADDFRVGTGASGVNLPSTVTGINLGYTATAIGTTFNIQVSFYKDLDLVTATHTNILSNPVKTYTFSATSLAVGANRTGLFTFADGGFDLGTISNASTSSHGIVVKFLDVTGAPSTSISALFRGEAAPSIGSSADTYYRDVDGDGLFEGDEAKNFSGAPTLANLDLQLTGTVNAVPEPGTWAALGLGAVAVLRRRKRA